MYEDGIYQSRRVEGPTGYISPAVYMGWNPLPLSIWIMGLCFWKRIEKKTLSHSDLARDCFLCILVVGCRRYPGKYQRDDRFSTAGRPLCRNDMDCFGGEPFWHISGNRKVPKYFRPIGAFDIHYSPSLPSNRPLFVSGIFAGTSISVGIDIDFTAVLFLDSNAAKKAPKPFNSAQRYGILKKIKKPTLQARFPFHVNAFSEPPKVLCRFAS